MRRLDLCMQWLGQQGGHRLAIYAHRRGTLCGPCHKGGIRCASRSMLDRPPSARSDRMGASEGKLRGNDLKGCVGGIAMGVVHSGASQLWQ